jgi:tellurite resistance protein TerC
LFWVSLAFLFFGFLWWREGRAPALEYVSAYLMEWSLSIDNIFVFILIFSFFNIRADHVARALLIGILMAIVFRIIFISVGVVLVERFHWLLYVFGAFLVYTGIKIFTTRQEDEFDPATSPVYKFINRFFPIVHEDVSGKLTVMRNGKALFHQYVRGDCDAGNHRYCICPRFHSGGICYRYRFAQQRTDHLHVEHFCRTGPAVPFFPAERRRYQI